MVQSCELGSGLPWNRIWRRRRYASRTQIQSRNMAVLRNQSQQVILPCLAQRQTVGRKTGEHLPRPYMGYMLEKLARLLAAMTVVECGIRYEEVDMDASSMKAELWHGLLCYEKSEMEGSETFPLTEEGRTEKGRRAS